MKTTAYYTKTFIVVAFLALESFFLSTVLFNYASSENYFNPGWQTLVLITVLLLVICYTYALTAGAWNKWEQFVVVPLPIAAGIFVALIPLNFTYALVAAASAYLLLAYDVWIATNISKVMTMFSPRIILRFSTRGILFLFAAVAAIMVILHSAGRPQFNLGEKIGEFAQEQFYNVIAPQMGDQATNQALDELENGNLPVDPELFGGLSGLRGNSSSLVGLLPRLNLDLKNIVAAEVNNLLEPYRQFITPLIALIVFALIRFLGSIANFFFNITIDPVFALAKKAGLLIANHIPVEKEVLSYSKEDTRRADSTP